MHKPVYKMEEEVHFIHFFMKQQNLDAKMLQSNWFEENCKSIYFVYIDAKILNEIYSWNQQYIKRIKGKGGKVWSCQ